MDTTAPIAPIDTETHIDIELSDTELEELQHLALSEGCYNPQEAMWSRTAKVVLRRVSSQVFRATNGEWFSPMIVSIYNKFLSKTPITKKEQTILSYTLQDSDGQQRVKDIVSKLKFAQWDENDRFFALYMKDHNDMIDPTALIGYIINQIENYTLVLDENEDNIQELGRVAWAGTYYTCEEAWDGAEKWKKLILVTEKGKMVRFDPLFINTPLYTSIKIFDNWRIFWVTWNKDRDSESPIVWNIFENNNGNLATIYQEEWVFNMDRQENWMIITTCWKNLKMWLLKEIVLENEKWKFRKIEKLMPAKEDTIELVGDLILTSKKGGINWVHMYDESAKKDTLHWYSHIKTLLPTLRNIQSRGNWYFTATNNGKVDVYLYNAEKEELIEIDWLQWIVDNEEEIKKLLQWEIAYLQYAGKGGLYALDIKIGKLNKLATIELGEWTRLLSPIVINDKISIYYLKDWKESKVKNLWLQNWKIYESAWFFGTLKLTRNIFSSSSKDENIDPSSFQSIQSALKEVVWPIRL